MVNHFSFFSEQNTWEPEENLDCPELIQRYNDSKQLSVGKRKLNVNGGEGDYGKSKPKDVQEVKQWFMTTQTSWLIPSGGRKCKGELPQWKMRVICLKIRNER